MRAIRIQRARERKNGVRGESGNEKRIVLIDQVCAKNARYVQFN